MTLPLPRSYPGAVYQGIAVGVAQGDQAVRPVSDTWLDRTGRFQLVLPKRLAGQTVSLWEGKLQLFSVAAAAPGGTIDLQDWPSSLPADVPRGLGSVRLR